MTATKRFASLSGGVALLFLSTALVMGLLAALLSPLILLCLFVLVGLGVLV